MIKFVSFFNKPWAEALGWTLVHSLWQALLVMLVVFVVLRFLPKKSSTLRYAISAAGLFTIVISSVITFLLLFPKSIEINATRPLVETTLTKPVIEFSTTQSFTQAAEQFVHNNTSAILLLWITGMLLFSMRLLVGWYYVNRLRMHATILSSKWVDRVKEFSRKLSISRVVTLAESAALQTPVTIGYLKPMILFPIGMLSGLTTEEVETILLHELAHIKRHDYSINIAQSIFESVLFFNPFVWLLSNIIRQEREHCCDDVVTQHGNVLAYAYALTRLEEVRLTQTALTLSLATTKHQLLNRIKRIMEKSAKNYSYRDRIIPIALLLLGLTCVSFLTLSSSSATPQENLQTTVLAQDTVKQKKKIKSATYSRKSITTVGKDGKPNEETVESFEGDEDLRPLFENDADGMRLNFPIPPRPDLSMLNDLNIILPPMPDWSARDFGLDTIPHGHWNHDGNWEEFGQEFESRMKNMEMKFNGAWEKHLENAIHKQEEAMARLHDQKGMRHHEEAMQKMEEAMKHLDINMDKLNENLKELDKKMKAFQAETLEQLIQDGYLTKNEKIKNMNWDAAGDITVNGIKIKDKDKAKYQAIHRKYFKDKGHFWYSE